MKFWQKGARSKGAKGRTTATCKKFRSYARPYKVKHTGMSSVKHRDIKHFTTRVERLEGKNEARNYKGL